MTSAFRFTPYFSLPGLVSQQPFSAPAQPAAPLSRPGWVQVPPRLRTIPENTTETMLDLQHRSQRLWYDTLCSEAAQIDIDEIDFGGALELSDAIPPLLAHLEKNPEQNAALIKVYRALLAELITEEKDLPVSYQSAAGIAVRSVPHEHYHGYGKRWKGQIAKPIHGVIPFKTAIAPFLKNIHAFRASHEEEADSLVSNLQNYLGKTLEVSSTTEFSVEIAIYLVGVLLSGVAIKDSYSGVRHTLPYIAETRELRVQLEKEKTALQRLPAGVRKSVFVEAKLTQLNDGIAAASTRMKHAICNLLVDIVCGVTGGAIILLCVTDIIAKNLLRAGSESGLINVMGEMNPCLTMVAAIMALSMGVTMTAQSWMLSRDLARGRAATTDWVRGQSVSPEAGRSLLAQQWSALSYQKNRKYEFFAAKVGVVNGIYTGATIANLVANTIQDTMYLLRKIGSSAMSEAHVAGIARWLQNKDMILSGSGFAIWLLGLYYYRSDPGMVKLQRAQGKGDPVVERSFYVLLACCYPELAVQFQHSFFQMQTQGRELCDDLLAQVMSDTRGGSTEERTRRWMLQPHNQPRLAHFMLAMLRLKMAHVSLRVQADMALRDLITGMPAQQAAELSDQRLDMERLVQRDLLRQQQMTMLCASLSRRYERSAEQNPPSPLLPQEVDAFNNLYIGRHHDYAAEPDQAHQQSNLYHLSQILSATPAQINLEDSTHITVLARFVAHHKRKSDNQLRAMIFVMQGGLPASLARMKPR